VQGAPLGSSLGIYYRNGAGDGLIENNNISMLGGNSFGVRFEANSNSNILINNTIATLGDAAFGVYIDASSYSLIENNSITTSQSSANAFRFNANSDFNIISDNFINVTSASSIRMQSSGSNYPENNNFTNNVLVDNEQIQLFFFSTGINGTYLIDQPIENYTFNGEGGIVYFKDTTNGEIKFIDPINGSGTNLSNDIRISNNSVTVESTSKIGLNSSANITLYNMDAFNFLYPTILKDGVSDCLLTGECYNFTALNVTNVLFNVSGWTNYSIQEEITPPVVQLINPVNNSNTSIALNEFSCNITNTAIQNLTLYVWNSTGNAIFINSTNLTGTFNSSSWNNTFTYDDVYTWGCLGYDVVNNFGWAQNFTITYDSIEPVIELISPANASSVSSATQTFSCNISNLEVKNLTLYVWNSTDAEIFVNSTDLSNPFNETSWTNTLPYRDNYTWNCLGYDWMGHSAWATNNYSLSYQESAPTVTITAPLSLEILGWSIIVRANATDDFGVDNVSFIKWIR